jgi:hypothetical protein
MKHRKTGVFIVLVSVAVLSCAIFGTVKLLSQMNEKSEWAVLQGLEFSHRSSAEVSNVVFDSSNGYEAIGIRSNSLPDVYPASKFPRVWLLANSRYGPKVKKIPFDANYEITNSDLNMILRRMPNVSSAVQDELRRHAIE